MGLNRCTTGLIRGNGKPVSEIAGKVRQQRFVLRQRLELREEAGFLAKNPCSLTVSLVQQQQGRRRQVKWEQVRKRTGGVRRPGLEGEGLLRGRCGKVGRSVGIW